MLHNYTPSKKSEYKLVVSACHATSATTPATKEPHQLIDPATGLEMKFVVPLNEEDEEDEE
jgi:hypothetical protein